MFSLLFLLFEQIPIYLDPKRSVNDRIDDLMSKMTLEEKIGQMVCLDGRFNFDELFEAQHPGSVFYMFDDDAAHCTMLARNTRLKIPMLLGIDAIHGNSFYTGATIFPTQLAISCSWNEELVKAMGRVTAEEMNHTGPVWTFSPVLCVTRDLRWGRVDETFGEDVLLIEKFAQALIEGLQENGVLACAKHYAGYSETLNGIDGSESELSKRKLISRFLPPFQYVADKGVASYMTSYDSIDGTPAVVNTWLLQDKLRDEWGFDGFVVSDYNGFGQMVTGQNVFSNYEDAAVATVKAGNDMIMMSETFYDACLSAVNNGKLDVKYVDRNCRRILKAKFDLGLFEDDKLANKSLVKVGTPEHREIALQAAEESLVLLKNTGRLPLRQDRINTIAVIGPNADDPLSQNGDWSKGSQGGEQHPRNCTITVLDGIKERFKSGQVLYAKGAGIDPDDIQDINAAVELVEEADFSVVVIGDSITYAGEGKSTATLELMGQQKELLDAVVATSKPFALVIISSKPLILPDSAVEAANAIICQFNPGMLGGKALAEVLFGDISPSGKLTVSWPYHAGQLPLYYNQVRGEHGVHYSDLTQSPRYEFGYGLTYTEFRINNIKIDKSIYSVNDVIKLSLTVRNYGEYTGSQVIQVYLVDKCASVTWFKKELKAFQRVKLIPSEQKEVYIEIKVSDCFIIDADGNKVVEPGEFQLQVGTSSQSILAKLDFTVE